MKISSLVIELFYEFRGAANAPGKQGFCSLLQAGFLLRLVFDVEDGGDTFLRNVLPTFTGLHGDISRQAEVVGFNTKSCFQL
jgi:hypothetical protein